MSENWLWWRVVWAFTLHDNTSGKNWPWWRVVWDFTLHNNTWVKNWLWWRVVWDFTLHDNTSGKNLLWWRVVWDFTLHDNTSGKNWLWVLQRVVVPVCVVLCGSWISGCRLQWNGCFIVCHGCMNVAWASPCVLSKKGGWHHSIVDRGGLEVEHLKNGTPSSKEWMGQTNIS